LKQKLQLRAKIDTTAFAGIMLCLVFLFMAPIISYRGLPDHQTDLARTEHATSIPGANREDALTVTVTRNGSVYISNHPVTLSQLKAAIQEGLRNGVEKKAYVKADARAKYGDVDAVVAAIRSTGIDEIAFVTAQSER
jgi:biopolymer transport protein TolR